MARIALFVAAGVYLVVASGMHPGVGWELGGYLALCSAAWIVTPRRLHALRVVERRAEHVVMRVTDKQLEAQLVALAAPPYRDALIERRKPWQFPARLAFWLALAAGTAVAAWMHSGWLFACGIVAVHGGGAELQRLARSSPRWAFLGRPISPRPKR
jgi:hypothetical protein